MRTLVLVAGVFLVVGCDSGYAIRAEFPDDDRARELAECVTITIRTGGCEGDTLRTFHKCRDGMAEGAIIGGLNPGLYGFTAEAYIAEDRCRIAVGCTAVDLSAGGGSEIVIPLEVDEACCIPGEVWRQVDDSTCCGGASRLRTCGAEYTWNDSRWSECTTDPTGECVPGDRDTDGRYCRLTAPDGTRYDGSRTAQLLCTDLCEWETVSIGECR